MTISDYFDCSEVLRDAKACKKSKKYPVNILELLSCDTLDLF